MTNLYVMVTVELFGRSPDDQNLSLRATTEAREFPVGNYEVADMAKEALGSIRFALFGGTGNPNNPWFEDQDQDDLNEVQK